MAKRKRGGPNKSLAIRNYLDEHANAKPKEISAALASKGIDVAPGFVSTIKTKYFADKRGGRSITKRGSGRNGHTDISLDDLLVAKQFASKFGGIERAKQAFDALAKLL